MEPSMDSASDLSFTLACVPLFSLEADSPNAKQLRSPLCSCQVYLASSTQQPIDQTDFIPISSPRERESDWFSSGQGPSLMHSIVTNLVGLGQGPCDSRLS